MEGGITLNDQAQKLREAAVNHSIERPGGRKKRQAGQCRVITVTSGKGGVGKTSLVVNLGLALTRIGYRVVIIDADLGLANIDVMLNALPRYNLGDVISGEKLLRDIIIRGPLDLKIVPGGSGLFDLANLDQSRRTLLLDQLGDLENEADYIIIDTAAGLSRNVIGFVAAADDFILVTTPEPTALTDAYGMLKVIAEKDLLLKGHIVVNLTRNLQEGRRSFNGLYRVVQKYLPVMNLVFLGEIRYDPVVSNAVHDFTPFVISRPNSAAAVAMTRIAWRIAANGQAEKADVRGIAAFVKRLKSMVSTEPEEGFGVNDWSHEDR